MIVDTTDLDDFGVYVHIPFCRHRCDYCAFATWTDRDGLMVDYANGCRREVAQAELPDASSVFFGGGTPSLLPAHLLVAVLESVSVRARAEVTVECNPETVTAALLDCYRAAGVNRLSFGVQSLAPDVLAALGRRHDPASVERSVSLARDAGFSSINLDLIFGGAGESLADWAATLDGALALQPDHISAYALTVEAGTPLAQDPARWPDDDEQADKYLLADERLEAAGLIWYEISNWARPGWECRHNRLYWAQGDYRGVGCAAHSHQAGRRWWNVRTPERYLERIRSGRSPVGGEELLDPEAGARERGQLALRTRDGVETEALPDAPGLEDLVAREGGRAVLTVRGRLLANEVAAHLLARPVGSSL
ncbi:MAG: radical SAM family heme chaperone HemW [Actinomycetota bacterium]|nr:radical SAM family heme chaperone HemW [Actinomycetota bacterium]MDQ6948179.1 radical SAM family heme chaperone HemW [Actinomycetota bacterium]